MFLERFIRRNDTISDKLEWLNEKRSWFLRLTDTVIWLFYRISWQRMLRRSTDR